MEDIDGGLHPAVDGQSLDEDEDEDVRSQSWGFCMRDHLATLQVVTFCY